MGKKFAAKHRYGKANDDYFGGKRCFPAPF